MGVHVHHLNGGQLLEGESRLLEGFPQGGRLLRDGDGEGHVPGSSTVDATDDCGCLEGTDQERRSCHEVEGGQDKGRDGGENVWRRVFMEHGDCFSSCMKIGEKTINVKGKVTGDFIVEELDVDGSLASRMKQILVRQ